MSNSFLIYGRDNCTYCVMAKNELFKRAISFEYIDINKDDKSKQLLKSSGYRTVPQIFYNGHLIGGHDKLIEFLSEEGTQGELFD